MYQRNKMKKECLLLFLKIIKKLNYHKSKFVRSRDFEIPVFLHEKMMFFARKIIERKVNIFIRNCFLNDISHKKRLETYLF